MAKTVYYKFIPPVDKVVITDTKTSPPSFPSGVFKKVHSRDNCRKCKITSYVFLYIGEKEPASMPRSVGELEFIVSSFDEVVPVKMSKDVVSIPDAVFDILTIKGKCTLMVHPQVQQVAEGCRRSLWK